MLRNRSRIGIVVMAALALCVGCNQNEASENARNTQASNAPRSQDPPKPRVETVVVPAGTAVVASLQTALSTETNQTGDRFIATTVDPIVAGDRVAIPAGARVSGSLSNVQASGRVKGRAEMTLRFEEIIDSQGRAHSITAEPITLRAESGTQDDVEKIAAGTIAGAIIGGITGGKKGAAVGAGVGAGAGTVVVLATKGDDIELNPGQKLNVQLTAPKTIPIIAQL